jgi:hypothetical protein
MSTQPASQITKKKIRKQIEGSLNEMLTNLHIETGKKKIKKLVEKFSRKLTSRAIHSLKKDKPAKRKTALNRKMEKPVVAN